MKKKKQQKNHAPANLFARLPALAIETIVNELVALGSKQLVELMRCSKVTRELVLRHTPQMRLRDRLTQNQRQELKRALGGRSAPLHIRLLSKDVTSLMPTTLHGALACVNSADILIVQEMSHVNVKHLLPACPNLTSLQLSGCGEVAYTGLWDAMSARTSLTRLALGDINLAAPVVAAAADLARKCPHLTSLSLTLSGIGQIKVLEAVAPQLRSLTLRTKARHSSTGTVPAKALPAIANSQQLTSFELHGTMDQALLDTLVSLPKLTTVTLSCLSLTRSHADTSCAWRTVYMKTVSDPSQLARLPLKQLRLLQIGTMHLNITSDDSQFQSQVDSLASCLQQPAQLQWCYKGAPAFEGMPYLRLTKGKPKPSSQAVQTQLGMLAPLTPFLQGRLVLSSYFPRLLPGQLRALSLTSLGGTLIDFGYRSSSVETGLDLEAWQQLPTLLPRLQTLRLVQVDKTELAIAALTHPGPQRLKLVAASFEAVHAVHRVLWSFASRGAASRVWAVGPRGERITGWLCPKVTYKTGTYGKEDKESGSEEESDVAFADSESYLSSDDDSDGYSSEVSYESDY